MKRIVQLCGAFVLLVLGSTLNAKTIDLRNMTDAAGEHDVSFCARPSPGSVLVVSGTTISIPGHAFVAFSHRPPNGERTFQAIGHTVAAGTSSTSAAWSFFGSPVSGLIAEERFTHRLQECLTIKLNKSEFDELRRDAFASLQEELGIGLSVGIPIIQHYRLGEEDCVSFMIGIAEAIEEEHEGRLKIPDDDDLLERFPMQYIRRFIEAN